MRYDRAFRTEAGKLFVGRVMGIGADRVKYSLALRPPTERYALERLEETRLWAAGWRAFPVPECVVWERRNWPSVGTQEIPVRVVAHGIEQIARCAQRERHWTGVSARVDELAQRACSWSIDDDDGAAERIAAAVAKTVEKMGSLPDDDWRAALGVLDWLAGRPSAMPFVRQLPVRGIDTKWMERHRSLIGPLSSALFGRDVEFAKPQGLVRVHALDPLLAFGGVTELGVPVGQLQSIPRVPDVLLVCENLVNVVALPPLEGVLAVHGGGFAVAELDKVDWAHRVHVLYWGDLDSNGFAILNRLRSHLPHAASVMMDEETLTRHRELCVEEPAPVRSELRNLTECERRTVAALLAGDEERGIAALRLEQERIEWGWACERLREAVRDATHVCDSLPARRHVRRDSVRAF